MLLKKGQLRENIVKVSNIGYIYKTVGKDIIINFKMGSIIIKHLSNSEIQEMSDTARRGEKVIVELNKEIYSNSITTIVFCSQFCSQLINENIVILNIYAS